MTDKRAKKRETKAAKEAARQEARRKQRQQTIFTGIVIAIILVIGGVLIAVSIGDPGGDVAESPTDLPTDLPTGPTENPLAGIDPCAPEPAPEGAGEEKGEYEEAPTAELEEGTDYRAVVQTTCGEFVVDLYEDRAPIAVANFIGLVEDGFYDNLSFFRNAKGIYAIQSGSATGEATYQVGYTFEDELAAAEEEGYTEGSLAMANSGPDTNGSQIFLTYGTAGLPPAYTKFGQVTEGLEVVKSIGAIPNEESDDPLSETPSELAYITSVTIEAGPAAADEAPTGEAPTENAPTENAPAEDPTAEPTE